jgi:hypothetical protein
MHDIARLSIPADIGGFVEEAEAEAIDAIDGMVLCPSCSKDYCTNGYR